MVDTVQPFPLFVLDNTTMKIACFCHRENREGGAAREQGIEKEAEKREEETLITTEHGDNQRVERKRDNHIHSTHQ